MRAAAIVALVPLLHLSGTEAATPTLDASAFPTFEYAFPGAPETISGELRITIPSDSTCEGDISFEREIFQPPPNVTVVLNPAGGVFPAAEIAPGAVLARDYKIVVEPGLDAVAYDTINIRVRTRTGSCGNVDPAQAVNQTGTRVGFLPWVRLDVVDEDEERWRVRALNLGNARVGLEWSLLQPSLGRVLDTGEEDVAGPPEPRANATTEFTVAKSGLDRSQQAQVSARILYRGGADEPFSPENVTTIIVHRPQGSTTAWQTTQTYALVLLAVVAVAVAGWALWTKAREASRGEEGAAPRPRAPAAQRRPRPKAKRGWKPKRSRRRT